MKREYKKIIAILLVFVVVVGGFLIKSSFAARNPIKSVTITSKNVSYENKEPGAWNVIKSAKWLERGKAQITFNVDTILKSEERDKDIILVLDVSGSMDGEKISRVKEDATDLVDVLLTNPNNNAALISFETSSRIIENLTNNKDLMIEQINNLTTTGCTNYYQALKNVETILNDYKQEQNRDMVVLFLTDGYPNEDTPNEVAEYGFIKSEYPYATINGIQYEMGEDILDPIKKISDNQYIADMETLNNVLFDASILPLEYENFTITDYINDEYFNIESIDEVETSIGEAKLEYEGKTPKVIWNINNLKSGKDAKMTINVTLKEKLSEDDLYPTNKKETIESYIKDNQENVTSNDTPILANNYKVIYEANAPEGCTIGNLPSQEKHLIFEHVNISNQEPTCEGYIFNGWEIVTDDVKKISYNSFQMPDEDVIIRATWSTLKLAKSMDGTVAKKVAPIMKKRNSSYSTEAFWRYSSSITSIVFEDWINIPADIAESKKWDVSAENNGSVMAYIESDGGNSSKYRLHIQGEDGVIANTNSSYLFDHFSNLTSIEGLNYFDTTNVTDMSQMFYCCEKLTNLDVSNFKTSNVTKMDRMFMGCEILTTIDVSNFDTSKVTDMESMFCQCEKLTNLNVNNFNTSNVTDMSHMFSFCKRLTSLNVSSFDTRKVIHISHMFAYCEKLTSIDLSNFDTSQVKIMFYMFQNCSSLTSLDLSNFDTSNVTDMSSMFDGCSKLTTLDVSKFDTSQVKDMGSMFDGCSSLTTLDIRNFDTSQVKDMSSMFDGCSSLITVDVSHFDTSKVTNMYYMFYKCNNLTTLDISSWNTSNVRKMCYMFEGCRSLTTLDVSHFDTSKVTNMASMFYGCSKLTTLDVSNFDTTNVTDMTDMFHSCGSLTLVNVSNFDTTNVTNMANMFQYCSSLTTLDVSNFNTSEVTDMSYMFSGCSKLSTLDIGNFDTTKVTYMSYIFSGCSKLSAIDVSNINTSKVTNMSGIFGDCSSLTTLDLSSFDTSKVTSMANMFNGCSSLTSVNLSKFNTAKVTDMSSMFSKCSKLTSLNLSNFDTSKVTSMPYMFSGCSSLTTLDISNFDTTKVTYMLRMFNYVKKDCLIIVKDDVMVNWVKDQNSNFNNVKIKGTV